MLAVFKKEFIPTCGLCYIVFPANDLVTGSWLSR